MAIRPLLLERLEDRILLSATPVATIDIPAEEFINENFDFSVAFDNTSAGGADSTGFAPYVDVVIPPEIDSAGVGVSFLGAAVEPVVNAVFDGVDWQFNGAPLTEHPLTGIALNTDPITAAASPGDRLLIVQLPFGSFTFDQPVATLDFSGLGLEGTVGAPNEVLARGGFAFGEDEFDNPMTDAPLVQGLQSGLITPTVIELVKNNDAEEGETATGPNYPRTFTLTVDIATGETIEDLNLSDVLPTNAAYIDSLVFNAGGTPTVISQPVADTDAPNLVLDYGDVTGVAGADIVVTYRIYIPDVIPDVAAADDAAADNPFTNMAQVSGTHMTNPVGDNDTSQLTGKLLAVQKGAAVTTEFGGVSNGPTPGDTVTYTLNFQVSDFEDFSAISLTDTVGNGLEVDTGFIPTFSFNENGTNLAGNFTLTSAANNPFTGNVTQSATVNGITMLVFDVSQQLLDAGAADGTLSGDPLTPATTGTITFRARILESFATPAPGGGTDLSVDINDTLTNSVAITGTSSGGNTEDDTSSASLTVSGVTLAKTIFAVDGDEAFDVSDGLSPGQEVTYRIRVELPTADIENLTLKDFLPLPVFDAASVAAFINTFPPAAGTPPAGQAMFGPDHNLNDQTFSSGDTPNNPGNNFVPNIATDALTNTIEFDFGTFDADPPTGPVVIDVLFTVALLDKPFGDGLFLTNQSVSTFGNTSGSTVSNTEIDQIVLNQPDLTLNKGVVESTNPDALFDAAVGPVDFNEPGSTNPFTGVISSTGLAATPIDANLVSGFDAGDIVTFALVVENTGGSAAFDVLLRDTIASGFVMPTAGFNIQVRGGDDPNTALAFVNVGGGLFSGVAGEGIRILDGAGDTDGGGASDGTTDPGAAGSIASRDGAPGSNILIVTYDLEARADISPTTLHENTGLIEGFGGRDNGTDFTAGFDDDKYTDTASALVDAPAIDKNLLDTDRGFTDGSDVAIGEIVTYELVITLPEGDIDDLTVTDLLPPGLTYVPASAVLITAAAGSTALTNDFAGTVDLDAVTGGGGSGTDITFELDDGAGGAVLVTNNNDPADNSIVLRFSATVDDVAGNINGQDLDNQARIDYTDADGATNDGTPGAAAPILSDTVTTTVVLPNVVVDKEIDLDTVDAGDVITVTLSVSNTGSADAFDVDVSDVIDPLKFINVVPAAPPAGFSIDNAVPNTVRFVADPGIALVEGASVEFTFTAEVTDNIVPGDVILNTAVTNGGNTLPGGGRNMPDAMDVDSVAVELGLAKGIVSTSEAHTGDPGGGEQVAVGEIVRYRLEVELPEAAALDLTLQDLVADGLTFIDPHATLDGNVRVAFVSDGGISSAGAVQIVDAAAFVAGDETTLAGITPVFELADINISNAPDSDVDVYTSGADVFFRLGDVTNADSDANKEYIVLEFNLLVDNVAANVAGTDLNNSFRALSDDAGNNTQIGSDSNIIAVSVAEPDVSVVKSIVTPGNDAGDTIVYEIAIANAGGADNTSAFDIRVLDDLDGVDPGTLNLVSAVFNPGSTGAALSLDATAGNLVDVTIDRLDAGETVTITVTATLAGNLKAGLTVDNSASLSYSGLPGPNGTAVNPTGSATPGTGGSADGERDGSGGGINTYTDTNSIAFTVASPAIDKRLVDESMTTAGIGNTVEYDLVITVPEGRTDNLRISDDIPAGLAIVSAQLITSAAGSTYLSSDFQGSIENAGAVALVGPLGNGADLLVDLGDIDATAGSATDGNQFVIRVTTLVLNAPATSGLDGAQTTFTNSASLTYLDPDDGAGNTPTDVMLDDPSDPTVTAVEPELSIDKSVVVGGSGTSGDAGDSVVWTIVVSHTALSTAPAFDLDLNDTLPAAFVPAGFVATIATPGDATALFDLTGNVLSTLAADNVDLALGQSLTITINGTLADSVAPGAMLTNTANLDYSTGDGDIVDVLGGAGGPIDAEDDERSRSIADDATVDVPRPTFEKTLIGTDEPGTADGLGEVAIGETVTYGIVLTLPEGTYTEIVISDDIPPGLAFDGTTPPAFVAPAGYAGTLPSIAVNNGGGGSGTDVTFTLGAFTVSGDNNAANNTLTLQYQAVVLDVPGNEGLLPGQTALDNEVGATLDDPNNPGTPLDLEVSGMPGVTTDAVDLEVVEPELVISKTSVVSRADAGDVVTYSVTINHSAQSTGSAFDIVVTDDLLGIAGAGNKLDLVGSPAVTTTAGTVVIGTNPPADQSIRVEIDRFDRTDAPIVVTYSALLNGNVNALADSVTNTAEVSWDSHGGEPAEERNATPQSDTHTIDVPLSTPEFDKSVIGSSLAHTGTDRLDPAITDLVVGETVTYRLVATFNEGTYGALVDATISDQLPDFLELIGMPRIVTQGTSGVGMNVTLLSSNTTVLDNNGGDGNNDFFSIDFNVDNVAVDGANPELLHDQIWVEFDARVLDADNGTNNLNGNTLTNTATLTFDPAGANVISMASADIEIVDPLLLVSKTASDTTPNLGDTVTYTVVISHAPGPGLAAGSGVAAYDLVFNDALAAELTLVAGSVTLVESPVGFATTGLVLTSGNGAGDTSVDFSAASLELFTAPEGSLTLTYDAVVTGDPLSFSSMVTNTATVSYDGIPGDDTLARMKTASGMETLTIVGPDLVVTKDDGAAAATPGDALTYTIRVDNKTGPFEDDATNVSVVDTLPLGVSFVSSPDGSFVGFDPLTRELRWLLPLLTPGTGATLTVNAMVDDPAPAATEVLTNTVNVSSDDIDPTPGDNTATDMTTLNAAPDLSVTKTNNRDAISPGDTSVYTIVVSNNGNQASSGVVVTDTFTPGLYAAVSASQPAGVTAVAVDTAGGTVTWQIAELGAGEAIALTVNATLATALPAGVEDVTNTVGVGDDGRSGPDANPGDEVATDTDQVPDAAPDYSITKTNDADGLTPGDTTTYRIEVRNVGTQEGTGIVVVDTFDPDVLVDVSASDGGVVDAAAGTVTWHIARLAGGGASIELTLTATVVQVPPAGVQSTTNAVSVTDDGNNGPDPTAANNRASDTDDLQVFVFDSLNNDAVTDDSPLAAFFADGEQDNRFLQPLPVDVLFTGHAEPHTVLVITLYDDKGGAIGQQVAVTDSGGNWVANFGGTILSGQPHAITIAQQPGATDGSTPGSFNLRTYFSPALGAQLFFSYVPDAEAIFSRLPGALLESLSAANENPLSLGWNKTNNYEFLASSSTTTQSVN